MNVFKRCACVAPCDHAYHFKFKHRGRTYRESTHIANHKLAGRAADRRRLQIAGRRAGLDGATDHTQVRLSDLRTMYDAWVVTTYRTPVHALKLSRLLAEFFPDDPYLVDISAFDLERWRSHRLKTISRRTLHAQFGIVKGMFRQAAIWFPGFARPDMGIGRTRPDEAAVPMLTSEELSYTLTQLPALLALMARVTLETLARLGEILRTHGPRCRAELDAAAAEGRQAAEDRDHAAPLGRPPRLPAEPRPGDDL